MAAVSVKRSIVKKHLLSVLNLSIALHENLLFKEWRVNWHKLFLPNIFHETVLQVSLLFTNMFKCCIVNITKLYSWKINRYRILLKKQLRVHIQSNLQATTNPKHHNFLRQITQVGTSPKPLPLPLLWGVRVFPLFLTSLLSDHLTYFSISTFAVSVYIKH